MADEAQEAEERWFRGIDDPAGPEPTQIEMMDQAELEEHWRYLHNSTHPEEAQAREEIKAELLRRIAAPNRSQRVGEKVLSHVTGCARCGEDHLVGFRPIYGFGEWTHLGMCPRKGEPIVMRIITITPEEENDG